MRKFHFLQTLVAAAVALQVFSPGTAAADNLQPVTKAVGQRLPTITADSLAGSRVTLPDDARGRIALILVAFARDAQSQLDSWMEPFADATSAPTDTFVYYEVPMISGFMAKAMSGVINNGMRKGISEEKHPYVVVYYGDTDDFRNKLGMTDDEAGYALLLDGDGVIRQARSGMADDASTAVLIEEARTLAEAHRETGQQR